MGPLRSQSASLSLSSFGDDTEKGYNTGEYADDKWMLFMDGFHTFDRTRVMIFRDKSVIEMEKKIHGH